MARKPREKLKGGIYHVYARGNARERIYHDAIDRHVYLRRLDKVTSATGWRCLSYCLMNNHVHLLLETPHANLSAGMQRLHGAYAQYFNARHGRPGHVFQGRFGSVRIKSDGQLCTTAAYIARNPVEAGLCQRPEDWPWSSYRALRRPTGSSWVDSDRLLSFFACEPSLAIRRLELMVREEPVS